MNIIQSILFLVKYVFLSIVSLNDLTLGDPRYFRINFDGNGHHWLQDKTVCIDIGTSIDGTELILQRLVDNSISQTTTGLFKIWLLPGKLTNHNDDDNEFHFTKKNLIHSFVYIFSLLDADVVSDWWTFNDSISRTRWCVNGRTQEGVVD